MNFKPHEILILGVLCTLILLTSMNSVIFSVSMLVISTYLFISQTTVSWILVGYTSIIAVGEPIYGKLSGSYPVRRLLIYGVLLFILVSIIDFIGHKCILLFL